MVSKHRLLTLQEHENRIAFLEACVLGEDLILPEWYPMAEFVSSSVFSGAVLY